MLGGVNVIAYVKWSRSLRVYTIYEPCCFYVLKENNKLNCL